MTRYDIQLLLEEAAKSTFLGAVDLLQQKEGEYKKSNFYKINKIPLLILFENYAKWDSFQTKINPLNNFVDEFDTTKIVSKIKEIFEKLSEDEAIREFFSELSKNFDYEQIKEMGDEVMKSIQKFSE